MRIATKINQGDAGLITLAAESILAAAQHEMAQLGFTVESAPHLTRAPDLLNLSVSSAQRLVDEQTGLRHS